MASDQLKAVFEAMRARLQAELDAQLATIESQHERDLDETKRALEARAARDAEAQLEAVRGEWAARLESERGALGTAHDHRLSEELARVRAELEEAANLGGCAAARGGGRARSEREA